MFLTFLPEKASRILYTYFCLFKMLRQGSVLKHVYYYMELMGKPPRRILTENAVPTIFVFSNNTRFLIIKSYRNPKS